MRIAILGATPLAASLAHKFIKAGLQVKVGVRPDFVPESTTWKLLHMQVGSCLSYSEACKEVDIIFLCTENTQLESVMRSLQEMDPLAIVDSTNAGYKNCIPCNATHLQERLPQHQFYKAFNNLGIDYPQNDRLGLLNETYFCGPEGPTKERLKRLISCIGFHPIDAGGLEHADLLEAFYHLRSKIAERKQDQEQCHFKLISY
ncbi:MAG: NADPH-dependent F420 reductase [Nitritalea sp.]